MLDTAELIVAIRELQYNSNPLHFEDAIEDFVDKSSVKVETDEDCLECLERILDELAGRRDWLVHQKALGIIDNRIDVDIWETEEDDEPYDYELSFI